MIHIHALSISTHKSTCIHEPLMPLWLQYLGCIVVVVRMYVMHVSLDHIWFP